jgi:Legionella pneumophila major outer membrane protein precursor
MKRFLISLFFTSSLLAAWQCPLPKKCKCYNSSIDDSDLFKRCDKVIFTNLEFLYWKVEEGADDYAIKMTKPPRNATTTLQAQGEYERASFDWSPGLRASVGYFNAPKYWEIRAQYTWLYSKGNESVLATGANLFLNGTFTQYLLNSLTSAETKNQLHYHVADILVDRMFLPNPHLRMRLYVGLTGGFFDQKWGIRYLDDINTTTVMNQWDFSGGGFRVGASVDWFWGCDFYVTGLVTFASLVGRYKNFSDINTDANVSGSDNVEIPFKETTFKDTRLVFQPQFYLGPSYQRSFCCNRFEIFAGYELNAWFNLIEVFRSSQNSAEQSKETFINTSVLGLHGLTVRATFDF